MSLQPPISLAYVGLGSNLRMPLQQVRRAVFEINEITGTRLLRTSSWYRSSPVGPGPQPDYINGVALIETMLSPLELLAELQNIEKIHGRTREARWAARTLDLDILLFDQQQISKPQLTIPHPRLAYRNFVLYPLAELAPDLILPDQRRVSDLLANASSQGIVRLDKGHPEFE